MSWFDFKTFFAIIKYRDKEKYMIIVTEKNKIEVKDGKVFIDGETLVSGDLTWFFTDQEADSTFHLDAQRSEPQIGDKLVVFRKGEEHPVYQSEPIVKIQ